MNTDSFDTVFDKY